jgi:N-acetylneuraminic acid mutarotase
MNFTKSLTPAKILLCGACALVGLLSLSSISLAQEPWTTKTDMPTARAGFSASVVDGKIYAIGGATIVNLVGPYLSTVEMYDPATDTWTAKAPMSTGRIYHYSAVVNGIIYVFGGDSGNDTIGTVEAYDPASDSWTNKSNMSSARGAHRAVAVNGKIYVIGGTRSPDWPALKIVEEYDPATDTWTRKADMPIGKWCFAASVVDGIIYVIGGQSAAESWSSTVYAYNPATDTWTQKTNMPTGRTHFSACAVNGIIFAVGGGTTSSVSLSTVEAYDPVTDTWDKNKANMPTPRMDFGISTVNGKINVIGGVQVYLTPGLSTVEEYDPHLDLLSLIDKIEVDKSYAKPGTDSVCITTKIKDPSGITIMAHIEVPDQSPVDSLELFDDGNHNDGNAGDSLYANVWPVSSAEEQQYYIDLKVKRVDTDTVIHHISNMATFTTIGPVTVENYTFTGYDTIPNPGDKLKLKITLRNNGSADTATKVTARLISLDSLVTIITSSPSFGNIVAGQNAISSYKYTLTIDEEWPGNTSISILVEISGEDYPYWKDTLYIPVLPVNIKEIREPITRIYPNPTNDLLNIEISNSGKQGLEIEIRDITGKVIYQKKYNNANAHFTEQFDLSGFTKGIYLIKVRQADRVYVGKIIVR